jgi:uncharacterized protein (DUF2252 family)
MTTSTTKPAGRSVGSSTPDPADLKIDHVSRQEAVERGKAARQAVPRSAHSDWKPDPHRPNPVDIMIEQAATREPDLIPIRHARMLVSPFTFYRGAAAIMAADLATTPVSGLRVQLCGDAHLLNFGGYASPERDLVFDVNDFDETLPGPWEWDVKRLAASMEVAAREAGIMPAERRHIAEETVRGYREAMHEFAPMTEPEVWYARLDAANFLRRFQAEVGKKITPDVKKALEKAHSKDSLKAFGKLTEVVGGRRRIVADPPLLSPLRDLVDPASLSQFEDQIVTLFRNYRQTLQEDRRHFIEQYELVDIARKVVGVGSVGTRCWIVLLMGRDDNDPLFLQIKEAQDSVLAAYAGESKHPNQGQRVVEGQRLMQASSDIFLGWIRATGIDGNERDFYVRQLWDWKISVNPENFTPSSLSAYGRACGWTLARAHACSGDRISIAAYLGKGPAFDQAIAEFADAYANQNERDYEQVAAAVKSGVLEVSEEAG